MRLIMKAAFIDPHVELVEAWKSINDAKKAGLSEQAEGSSCFNAGSQYDPIMRRLWMLF